MNDFPMYPRSPDKQPVFECRLICRFGIRATKRVWITNIGDARAFRTDDMPDGEWNEWMWYHKLISRLEWPSYHD